MIFAKKIIAFLLVFIIIYVFAIFISIKFDLTKYVPNLNKPLTGGYGYSLKRFEEVKDLEEVDVLFIGSSHSYRSFDSRLFDQNNISTFNLGTSQQTPVNSYYLLKEYLPKLKPKIVFIECFWRVLQVKDKGVESSLDIISNKKISLETTEMALSTRNVSVYNSLIYHSLKNIVSSVWNEKQHESKYNRYEGRGYVSSIKKIDISDLKKLKKHAWQIKEHHLNYLKKCIDLCKKYNNQVFLVQTPVAEEFYNSVTNIDVIEKEIEKFSIENNIVFLNFNSSKMFNLLDSEKDFYDANHLNSNGVVKFDEEFILEINRLNLFNRPLKYLQNSEGNVLQNSNFVLAQNLNFWKLIGDENLLRLMDQGLNIVSKGDLVGLGQFGLTKGQKYHLKINLAEVKKGGVKIFNYNKELTSIRKKGITDFEFIAEYPSIYIYRLSGDTNVMIKNITLKKEK